MKTTRGHSKYHFQNVEVPVVNVVIAKVIAITKLKTIAKVVANVVQVANDMTIL